VLFPFPFSFSPLSINMQSRNRAFIGPYVRVVPDIGPLTALWDYPGEPVPECKTNLDFTETRDSEWQWHRLRHTQVCTLIQITMPAPHHSVLYRPDALPAAQLTASKH